MHAYAEHRANWRNWDGFTEKPPSRRQVIAPLPKGRFRGS
jgi:hypothetical protein